MLSRTLPVLAGPSAAVFCLSAALFACAGEASLLFNDVERPADVPRGTDRQTPTPVAPPPEPSVVAPPPVVPVPADPPVAPPGGAAPRPPPVAPEAEEEEVEAAPACEVFGPFGPPEVVGGLGLSGDLLGPVFSADASTIYFSQLDADENIFRATRQGPGAEFGAAQLVPNLDVGGSEEGTPFLSFDGLSLYFFSTRPGPGTQGNRDIWLAQRPSLDAEFAAAEVLPAVNGPGLEHLPRLSRDERTILFVSSRTSPNASSNLWVAQRANRADEFAAAVEVPGINSASREEGFSLAPDGLTLFFASNRGADLNVESELDMDLWVATRPSTSADFGAAESLVALNSSGEELDPQLSPDGVELLFTSSRAGNFQLLRAVRECISP